jgi:hypothetical protein
VDHLYGFWNIINYESDILNLSDTKKKKTVEVNSITATQISSTPTIPVGRQYCTPCLMNLVFMGT